jgi:hypothetical protein
MPQAPIYTVETRQGTEPWRRHWNGHGEQIALDAADALALERRQLSGFSRSIPVYPYFRVRQGKRVVRLIGPTQAREA